MLSILTIFVCVITGVREYMAISCSDLSINQFDFSHKIFIENLNFFNISKVYPHKFQFRYRLQALFFLGGIISQFTLPYMACVLIITI